MTAAPGWYPTPTGQQAYWDGYQWAGQPPRRTLNQGFAFLAGLSLLATVIPCLFWLVAAISGGRRGGVLPAGDVGTLGRDVDSPVVVFRGRPGPERKEDAPSR